MKHLKKYEDLDYSIGSYVLVDIGDFNRSAKIELGIPIDIDFVSAIIVTIREYSEFPFEVELANGERIEVSEDEIRGNLNKEEISFYKTEKDAYKFGL